MAIWCCLVVSNPFPALSPAPQAIIVCPNHSTTSISIQNHLVRCLQTIQAIQPRCSVEDQSIISFNDPELERSEIPTYCHVPKPEVTSISSSWSISLKDGNIVQIERPVSEAIWFTFKSRTSSANNRTRSSSSACSNVVMLAFIKSSKLLLSSVISRGSSAKAVLIVLWKPVASTWKAATDSGLCLFLVLLDGQWL